MLYFTEVIIETISNTKSYIYYIQTSLSLIQLIYHNIKIFIQQILLHKWTNFIINYLSSELLFIFNLYLFSYLILFFF